VSAPQAPAQKALAKGYWMGNFGVQ